MLTDAEQREVIEHGLSVEEVERQLALFEAPAPRVRIDRPCTIGDGIEHFDDRRTEVALQAYGEARAAGRVTKMVPASGAATRMFKLLLEARDRWPSLRREEIASGPTGDDLVHGLVEFMDGFERFAFVPALADVLSRAGYDLFDLARRGEFTPIVGALLSANGLDYASLPKGLLWFHNADGRPRTPFEEHMVEASELTRDADGICRIHFTVSEEHREGFAEHLATVGPEWERRFGVRYQVEFSTQLNSTDTVAADEHGDLFHTDEGHVLFRPGGHGALIANLAALGADLVHIGNIDNVVPDTRKPQVVHWRRVLVGELCVAQQRIHEHLRRLRARPDDRTVLDAAAAFIRDELRIDVEAERDAVLACLDRPIRVCGMVRNTGEPGGGPFWVRGSDGRVSRQIVESAQVDMTAPDQQRAFKSSTHFNPVDLACALRDPDGNAYDLRRHVDPAAVFISKKSHQGRELSALEHPGLWNGAMADWTTIFVDIPLHVFNPVKTVLDLLRPAHQPA